MTLGHTLAVALTGLEGRVVEVEAEVSAGLPQFTLVGLPDSSMLQARDRVRSAAGQIGVRLASRRIVANLIPAYLPKGGSGFDLPIAVAVLAAHEVLPAGRAAQTVHIGELGLDGRLRSTPGMLPSVLAAREAGARAVVVPTADAPEARLVDGIDVVGADDLAQVVRHHGGSARLRSTAPPAVAPPGGKGREGTASSDMAHETSDADHDASSPSPAAHLDFADVVGQAQARAAAETAAAGGHHLLLTGPPGAGKTMIAARMPGILPDLDVDDALAVSAVHSIAGRFDATGGLLRRPPYESPHHAATPAAVIGGGSGIAMPGAISRAHAGILFLDEAPEFHPRVLESLREPLESGDITLHRARGVTRYPARFQLVLAANPCPCGQAWGRGDRCTCTAQARRRYLSRLSGPILDRVDMRIDVGPASLSSAGRSDGEPSAEIRERVARARARQADRFDGLPFRLNAQIPGTMLRRELAPSRSDRIMLERAMEAGRLTMRGHDRVLRLAWTLADLDGADLPGPEHVGRALLLRGSSS